MIIYICIYIIYICIYICTYVHIWLNVYMIIHIYIISHLTATEPQFSKNNSAPLPQPISKRDTFCGKKKYLVVGKKNVCVNIYYFAPNCYGTRGNEVHWVSRHPLLRDIVPFLSKKKPEQKKNISGRSIKKKKRKKKKKEKEVLFLSRKEKGETNKCPFCQTNKQTIYSICECPHMYTFDNM